MLCGGNFNKCEFSLFSLITKIYKKKNLWHENIFKENFHLNENKSAHACLHRVSVRNGYSLNVVYIQKIPSNYNFPNLYFLTFRGLFVCSSIIVILSCVCIKYTNKLARLSTKRTHSHTHTIHTKQTIIKFKFSEDNYWNLNDQISK